MSTGVGHVAAVSVSGGPAGASDFSFLQPPANFSPGTIRRRGTRRSTDASGRASEELARRLGPKRSGEKRGRWGVSA
jgi:hypothetical protein